MSNQTKIEACNMVNRLIKIHGKNSKVIRLRILDIVNSEYYHCSNTYVTAMWDEYNSIFPS